MSYTTYRPLSKDRGKALQETSGGKGSNADPVRVPIQDQIQDLTQKMMVNLILSQVLTLDWHPSIITF